MTVKFLSKFFRRNNFKLCKNYNLSWLSFSNIISQKCGKALLIAHTGSRYYHHNRTQLRRTMFIVCPEQIQIFLDARTMTGKKILIPRIITVLLQPFTFQYCLNFLILFFRNHNIICCPILYLIRMLNFLSAYHFLF